MHKKIWFLTIFSRWVHHHHRRVVVGIVLENTETIVLPLFMICFHLQLLHQILNLLNQGVLHHVIYVSISDWLADILSDILAVYVAQIKHRERRDRDSSDERDPSEPKPDRTGTNHKNNHHRASRDTNDASSSNSSKQQNQQNNDDDSSSMTHDDDSSTKIKESSLIEPTTRRRHRRKKKPDKDTGFESISDKRYFVLCQ